MLEYPNISGYKVYYGPVSGQYECELNVGLMHQAGLSLPEEDCYIAVVAYNQAGAESEYSSEVVVEVLPEEITEFNLSDVTLPKSVHMYIGEGVELAIPYSSAGVPANNSGDFFTVEFVGLPEGVYASIDRAVYDLYAGEKEIRVRFVTESEDVMVPGEENRILMLAATPLADAATMILRSVGNPALMVEKQVDFVLEHHQPEVHEWGPLSGINNAPRELVITGDYFREGVQVLLGKSAIPVVSVEKNRIVAQVPVDFAAGIYDLTVQNDDGQAVGLKEAYQVLKPDYQLSASPARLLLSRGGGGIIYLTAEAIHEFVGQIVVEAAEVPAGIWVSTGNPYLTCGGEVAFEVSVAHDLAPGDYLLTFDGSAAGIVNHLKTTVAVIDGVVTPVIESFSRAFAVTGEPVTIYGQGFGHSGKVRLNGQELTVLDWGYNRIECSIPAGAVSGNLTVEAGGVESAPVELIVKEKNYTVTVNPGQILINRGKSMTLLFAVTGFSDPVDFRLENVPAGMGSTMPGATGIVPNYTLSCELATADAMPVGEYELHLVGTSNGQVKTVPFTVVVAELPEVLNQELAEGRVNVPFTERIDVEGGFAPYSYEILQNSLPAGLRFSEQGVFAGTPAEAGSYLVSVRVTDRVGSEVEANLPLKILGNEWITPEYDMARTGLTVEAGPAAADVTYAVDVATAAPVMLTSDTRVILLAQSAAYLYSKEDGSLVQQLSLPGAVVDALVTKDALVVLTDAGKLVRYRFADGMVSELAEGVSGAGSLALYRDTLLVARNNTLTLLDKEQLQVRAEYALTGGYTGALEGVLVGSWFCYVNSLNQLVVLDLETGSQVWTINLSGTVTELVGAINGVWIIRQDGQVERFNLLDGTLRKEFTHGQSMEQMIPYQNGFVVRDRSGLALYGLDGKVVQTVRGEFAQILVAGKRLYTAGASGISAYKLTTLSQVWNLAVPGAQVAMSGHTLYGVAGQKLYKFAAPTNVAAPQTTLTAKPDVADGQNGYYRQDVTVYLDALDQDNEVLVTYYALPDEFVVYQGGLTLSEGEHTLQYYSMDEEYKLEDVQTRGFKVDYTAPTVTLMADPADGNNGYYRTPVVQMSLEATDVISGVDTVYYRVNDGATQVYTEPFAVSDDGVHTVEYYAVDRAGNASDWLRREICIDTTAPTLMLNREAIDGENGYYVHAPVWLLLEGNDNLSGLDSVYYQVDGQGSNGIAVSGDGSHLVEYYGVDRAGNETAVASYRLQIDTVAPSVTLTAPVVDGENGYYWLDPVTVTLKATDNFAGVAHIYYRVDGGAYAEYVDGVTVQGEAHHLIEYYATDRAGNVADVALYEVKIDHSAPVVTLTPMVVDGENGYYVSNPVHHLSATDNLSGVTAIYYAVDGGEEQQYVDGIAVSGDGVHEIRYYAVDQAGNVAAEATFEFGIDTTVPEISLSAPPVDGENGYYVLDPVQLILTASDNFAGVERVYYRIDGGEYAEYVDGVTVQGEAHHLVEYYAVDRAGNATEVAQYEVKIDHTAPVVTLTPMAVDGENGFYVSNSVHHLSATDNLSGVAAIYYAVDGGEEQQYVDGIAVNGDGAHEIRYYAVDQAGNVAVEATFEFDIDTTVPEITLSAPPVDGENGYYVLDPVQLILTASDNFAGVERVYYRIDGGEYAEYVDGLTVQGEAHHLVEYYAVDRAGNTTEVAQYEVKIDHTAPVVTLTPMAVDGENGFYVSNPLHHLSATDNLSGVTAIYYAVDGGEEQQYVDGIRVTGDGAHEVRYYALDHAGNVAAVQTYIWKVDTTAPQTSLVRVKPLVNGTAVNLRLSAEDNYAGVAGIHYQVDDGAWKVTGQDINIHESGEHRVTYYAEDSAGNLEEAQQVTCYVKSLEEVDFVTGVTLTEFHNNLTTEQPWEKDRQLAVGDRIYLDEEYVFEMLPAELANARYLRTNRHANGTGPNDYYLEFTALVNLQVYLVVEASVTEIPGFTLVGQTKLTERMHFSEMQNLFMQQVSGNTQVRIPGSKLLNVGHAPLVIYRYDDSRDIPFAEIEALTAVQRSGQWYYDFHGYGYDYQEGMLEGIDLEWKWTANGQATAIRGDGGTLPIIFAAEPYELTLTLTAINSRGIAGVSRIYRLIVDQSGIYILQPANMDKFAPGSTVTLQGVKRDEMGNSIPALLTWEWRHDAAVGWISLGSGNLLTATAPEQKGEYHLRVRDGADEVLVKVVVQEKPTGKK